MQKLGLSPTLPRPLEALSDSELYEGSKPVYSNESTTESATHLSDSEIEVVKEVGGRHDHKASTTSITTSSWDWEWGDIPHKETPPFLPVDAGKKRIYSVELPSPSIPSNYSTPKINSPTMPVKKPFIQVISEREYFFKAFNYFLQNVGSLLEGKGKFSSCASSLVIEYSMEELNEVFARNSSNSQETPEGNFQELFADKNIIAMLDKIYFLPVNAVFSIVTGRMFGKMGFSPEEIEVILNESKENFLSIFEADSSKSQTETSTQGSSSPSSSEGLGNKLKRWFKPSATNEISELENDGGSPLRLSSNISFHNSRQSVKSAPSISYVKTLRLTCNQLQSLDLKYGLNYVRFSLASNASVNCSARIFLWKHSTKIVISDIDGTITKSDALGHIFTFVGKDWTHSGVANLYTLIHKNGYQFMYLTSRAIGRASSTREYLSGIDQNSFQLPVGPVLMSPDRLFAALHREVILKKPEEFKIIVLKDICRLFRRTKVHFLLALETEKQMLSRTKQLTFHPQRYFWSILLEMFL